MSNNQWSVDSISWPIFGLFLNDNYAEFFFYLCIGYFYLSVPFFFKPLIKKPSHTPPTRLFNGPSKVIKLILDQKLWNESIKAQLIELTQLDRKSNVRSKAYETLDSLSQDSKPFHVLYAYGLRDSALSVVRTCLSILNDRDPCFGADQAKPLEDVEEGQISNWISRLYATCPKESYLGFFESRVTQIDGIQLYLMNNDFTNYALEVGSESIVDKMVESMKNTFQLRENWWSSSSSISGLKAAINFYGAEIDRIEAMPETSLYELERLAQLRNKKAFWI
jgi:hypothetical protein